LQAEKEIEKQHIRSRIASDLHDEIGSNLSSIALTSHILENRLNGEPQYKTRLKDLESLAIQSAESIRDIVWFINPENDSFDKLINKMRHTTAQMLSDTKYTFNVNVSGNKDCVIDLEIRRNLFLIYKETLNNVIRHARAKNVQINLDQDKASFVLKVKDDGIGFDPDKTDGNGLKNFHKRAQAMNGSIKIDSKINRGTQIIITAKIP
jgi:signal transduction histidine kinase